MVMLLVTAGIEQLEGSRQIQDGNNETHPWSQKTLSNSKVNGIEGSRQIQQQWSLQAFRKAKCAFRSTHSPWDLTDLCFALI